MVTWPPAPIGTTVRLAAVSPLEKLRLAMVGVLVPAGYTVTRLAVLGAVTVIFSTTASASAATLSTPATVMSRAPSAPSGFGASAQYSRQLISWMALTFGDEGRWDSEDRCASGSTQNIIGEQHTLADGTVTTLTLPSVNVTSIQVWDLTRTTNYVLNLDYQINQLGVLTQIQRVTGGQIGDGALVLVDYAAASQNSSAYDTLANTATFRVDL